MNFLPHDIGNHFCEYAGIHIFFLVFFNLFIQDKTYVKLYRLLAWVSTCPYNLGLMKIIIKLYYKLFFFSFSAVGNQISLNLIGTLKWFGFSHPNLLASK